MIFHSLNFNCISIDTCRFLSTGACCCFNIDRSLHHRGPGPNVYALTWFQRFLDLTSLNWPVGGKEGEGAEGGHNHSWAPKSLHIHFGPLNMPIKKSTLAWSHRRTTLGEISSELKANGHFAFFYSPDHTIQYCCTLHTIQCTPHCTNIWPKHSVQNLAAPLIHKETLEIHWCSADRYMEPSHLESQQRKTLSAVPFLLWNLMVGFSLGADNESLWGY